MISFSFSLQFLILFNILLLLSISILFFHQKGKNKGFSYTEIKQDFFLYRKYIDRYYINNIYFTIFAIFVYVFTNFILFFILRVIALGQMTTVMKLSTLNPSLWNANNWTYIVSFLVFLISGLLLLKYLITLLFYEEVLKVRIYMGQFYSYLRVTRFVKANRAENYLKFITFISYRISTGTYNSELFKGDFDSWYNLQLEDSEEESLRDFYENIHIKNVAEYFMFYAKKYKIISKIFYYIAYIFNYFRKLCRGRFFIKGFYRYFIYSFFIIIFIIDIYDKHFFYVYYASFLYFFIFLYWRYYKFEHDFRLVDVHTFCYYFYKNERPYYLQRVEILNNIHNIQNYSKQNNRVFSTYLSGIKKDKPDGAVYNALNQMEDCFHIFKEVNIPDNKRNMAFIRAHIIILFIFLGVFLIFFHNMFVINIFNITISNYIIFLPIIIMIICAKKAYTRPTYQTFTLYEYREDYRENSYYKVLFWITCLFQGYLYWLLIIKSEIFMLDNETLLNISFILKLPEEIAYMMPYETIKQVPEIMINYDIMIIKKVYNIEEKINYLYDYFEHYAYIYNMELLINDELLGINPKKGLIDVDYFRHILRQIDFNLFLDKETTLKDIQVYIKLFLENGRFLEQFSTEMIEHFNEHIIKKIKDNYFNSQNNDVQVQLFLNTISTVISALIALDTIKFHVPIIEMVIKPTSYAMKLFAGKLMLTWLEFLKK